MLTEEDKELTKEASSFVKERKIKGGKIAEFGCILLKESGKILWR